MKDSIYRLESGEYVDLSNIVLISNISSNGYSDFKSFAWLTFTIHLQLSDAVKISMKKYTSETETNEEELETRRDNLVGAWKVYKNKQK